MRALKNPLRLRISRLENDPANPELPAEPGERFRRSPAAGVDRALAITHQLLRKHPEPLKAASDTPQDVRRLLGEDQRARDQPRPAHLRGHHVAATQLAVPDRKRLAR